MNWSRVRLPGRGQAASYTPSQGRLQKVCILADLIHQRVAVDLQLQGLLEGPLWYRRREERERSVCDQLKRHKKKETGEFPFTRFRKGD